MLTLPFKKAFAIALLLAAALLFASLLSAWTGPTATAPSGNVAAPINVGTTDQVKDAGISVNSFAVFGSSYMQDKLGINKTSPVVALHVVGSMILGNGGETCQAVTEGAIRYNSTSHLLELCDGTSWTSVGSSLSGPGAVQYAAPGTYAFTVPTYASLSVTVKGGGGGGGGAIAWDASSCESCTPQPHGGSGSGGGAGGASSFNSSVIGNGGGSGGGAGQNGAGGTGGAGTASGGATNTTGGGASGGSAGSACYVNVFSGGAGGAGGLAAKTYTSGQLTPGSTVTIVVGAAGSGGPGESGNYCTGGSGTAGSNGSVTISWE